MNQFLGRFLFALFGLMGSYQAFACDVTLSVGANIQNSLNSTASEICLNPGTYRPTATLTVPANKTLRGVGSNRDQVVIESQVTSGSNTVMIRARGGALLRNFTLTSKPGRLPAYGVFVGGDDYVTIWSLSIKQAKINVGISDSIGTEVLDTYMSVPGDPNDGAANPNLWINQSADIVVWYGAFYGGAGFGSDPSGNLTGDGELGVYDSIGVQITGSNFFNSGSSSIYFRNCDECSIKSTAIYNAKGFGLDLVDSKSNPNDGNDDLSVQSNLISGSGFGGIVIKLVGGNHVTMTGNILTGNNMTHGSSCAGINVIGAQGNLVLQSNSVSPAPVSCAY